MGAGVAAGAQDASINEAIIRIASAKDNFLYIRFSSIYLEKIGLNECLLLLFITIMDWFPPFSILFFHSRLIHPGWVSRVFPHKMISGM